ncbi:pilus assembly protein TadG-related protein [Deltaproteobacteria bacterium IMCC39524]|nr:pilus assembly protein TadG-related protein [Deltaproteobacteria bacterium IMCC39524]
MRNDHNEPLNRAKSRGSVLVLTAFLLTFFIGMAALAIDIGYLSTTKNELQNTADAAALAGAGYIGRIYSSLPVADQAGHTFTKNAIYTVVNSAALENKAAGLDVTIINDEFDVKIGTWNQNLCNQFTDDCSGDPALFTGDIEPLPQDPGATYTTPTAVSVIARRDTKAGSDKPISTFFAGVLGINELPTSAIAVASLSGPGTIAEGELILPFALSEHAFPDYCNDFIEFSPTTASCAAWHNFFDPINASNMESKLLGFIEGNGDDDGGSCEHCGDCETCGQRILPSGPEWLATNFDINPAQYPEEAVTPAAEASVDSFNFQGGDIAALFNGGYFDVNYDGATGTVLGQDSKPAPLFALFDYFRYRDGDDHDDRWTTTIPVYQDLTVQDESNDTPECDNANDNRLIVGFATIIVYQPFPPPATNINVWVDCEFKAVDARGGGGTYGNTVGSVPQLVK